MFAVRGVPAPIDPGNRGELACARMISKQIPTVILRKRRQFAYVVKRVTAVVSPGKSRFLQCKGKRLQIVYILGRRAKGRIVNDRRICRNQHEVTGSRGPSYLRKEMVTNRVLSRQREVGRNVGLGILHVIPLVRSTIHPGFMAMIRADIWRIRLLP